MERLIEYARVFTVAELLEKLQAIPNPDETAVRLNGWAQHGVSVRLLERTLTDQSTVTDVEFAIR